MNADGKQSLYLRESAFIGGHLLSQHFLYFSNEVLDVFPPVHSGADLREDFAIWRGVVLLELRLQLAVGARQHALQVSSGGFELSPRGVVAATHLLKRH